MQDASRLIRTGQAQTGRLDTLDALPHARSATGLYGMFDCTKRCKIKVCGGVQLRQRHASSALRSTGDVHHQHRRQTSDWTIVESYSRAAGSSIVLVQAYYKWPTIVQLPGFNLPTRPDGYRLLAAVRVFRNEPF